MDNFNKDLSALHEKELDIQDALKEEPHMENGTLDFTDYDDLLAQLREVRAEMASL